MKQTRRKFDPSFKAKVALEALKERETLQQLAVKYELHPNQISQWKQEFIENSALVFEGKQAKSPPEADVSELYHKIGKLEMEKEFLKKKLKTLRTMIDVRLLLEKKCKMSLREQCALLDINRSSVYYKSKGENSDNLKAMTLMDLHILDEPTAGVITMQNMLEEHGLTMSYERVRRLMRKAAIMPIYPRRMLTQKGENKYIYPYLLRGGAITRPNQVWQIDITYIPMKSGFMYLTAIIDVHSRYIVGWGLSNSLEASESLKVVTEAIAKHGTPDILNSDQGSQFTCKAYVEYLKKENIKISMDGKGRCVDNIYIERFWRTLKYQYVHLNPASDGLELYLGIQQWLVKYHYRRH